ncbi:MAG: response regulator [Deltaproteobacteria bacterium]|nr:response regulator [Deltaproteobacteria bacterium]
MKHEKILVVEDDPHLSSLIVEILKIEGYCAIENAANGLEGFEKYKALRPDLVLMDMSMPIMNGYESSQKIKQFDPNANIIILTGNPRDDNAQKIMGEGYASILLQKPFMISFLVENIRQLLASQSSNVLISPKDTGYVHSNSVKSFQCA